jgi:hypothetical protein
MCTSGRESSGTRVGEDGGGAGDAYPCIQSVAAITNIFTAMYGMITPRDDASDAAIASHFRE